MDAVAVAKLWLAVRPIKRWKELREKRKARQGQPAETTEVSMNTTVATQIVLAILRHAMTALAPLGLTVSDDWMVQTAGILVGAVGLAWSGVRKWQASKA